MILKKQLSFILLFMAVLNGCANNADRAAQSAEEASTVSVTVDHELYFSLPDEPGDIHSSEEFDFYVQTVAEGLSTPWGMAFLPNGSMLVTEREGNLRLIADGILVDEPVANVPEVKAQNQGGLLDVELHPDFERNGWIYMSYSKPDGESSMTAIFRAKYDSAAHALTDIEEIYVGHPFTERGHHYGSRIVFDHDGYLYFSIGDRGEMETAQDYNTSQGNLFRLHDDGSVPSDNPFVGEEEGLDEIFSYGHRNIQGMTVHPETGVVWTSEHGPRGGDEININNKPGANYGWPVITYGINYDGNIISEKSEEEGMEQPVMYWDPSIAPSGMAFITGDTYPGWEGSIMNGALSFQLLSRIVVDGEEYVKEERLLEGIGRIRDVQMGTDGYLYFANESDGTLNRLIPVE